MWIEPSIFLSDLTPWDWWIRNWGVIFCRQSACRRSQYRSNYARYFVDCQSVVGVCTGPTMHDILSTVSLSSESVQVQLCAIFCRLSVCRRSQYRTTGPTIHDILSTVSLSSESVQVQLCTIFCRLSVSCRSQYRSNYAWYFVDCQSVVGVSTGLLVQLCTIFCRLSVYRRSEYRSNYARYFVDCQSVVVVSTGLQVQLDTIFCRLSRHFIYFFLHTVSLVYGIGFLRIRV